MTVDDFDDVEDEIGSQWLFRRALASRERHRRTDEILAIGASHQPQRAAATPTAGVEYSSRLPISSPITISTPPSSARQVFMKVIRASRGGPVPVSARTAMCFAGFGIGIDALQQVADVRRNLRGKGARGPIRRLPPTTSMPILKPAKHIAVRSAQRPARRAGTREITAKATHERLAEEMAVNPKIFVMGEGIGKRGGNFNSTVGLYDLYGPLRLCDTPIAEAAVSSV